MTSNFLKALLSWRSGIDFPKLLYSFKRAWQWVVDWVLGNLT